MTVLDIGADRYHADDTGLDTPTLSASIATILLQQSPAHARENHPKLNPDHRRVDEERFDVGTVVHALLLQGETIVETVDAKDWRTKAAQEQRDEIRARRRIPLLEHHWSTVQHAVDRVRERLADLEVTPAVFAAGKPERTLVWEEDGVHCRALVDWLHDDHSAIDDLKTTARSASPDAWTRSTLFGIGADVQAAFYLRGARKVLGTTPEFRFVVVEMQPPFEVAVVGIGPDVLELANRKVDTALRTWRECLRTGVWPGYPREVCFATLPPWEESRWLERELREAS